VFDWIALDSLTGLPLQLYRDTLPPTLSPSARRMAMVTSYLSDRFHPELIRRLAVDSSALNAAATAIASRMVRGGYRGLVIDFEGMTGPDTALTRSVVTTIANVVRTRGLGPVVVALPASDTVGYPARLFESSADLLLIMLYDQHWPRRRRVPLLSRRGCVARCKCAWPRVARAAWWLRYRRTVTCGGPNVAANRHLLRRRAPPRRRSGRVTRSRPATSMLHAVRAVGDQWNLWVSDAGLLSALIREVAALNVNRVAYWRLGTEDVAMW
jgi:spore germination protein YaaH